MDIWVCFYVCLTTLVVTSYNSNEKESEEITLVRHKRMIIKDHEWTNAIVPYIYEDTIDSSDKNEILTAIDYIEKYSCIRFVYWTNDTRQKYNLDHDGYVRFKDAGACFADVGNKRKPQDCSCCDRDSCVHELGHVLGLYHSHRSNNAKGWIRVNWDEIRHKYLYVYRVEPENNVVDYMYDITSIMHYPGRMYKSTYRPTISNLIPGLIIGGSKFYPLRDINWYHSCAARMCSWSHKACHNDGFLTTVKGNCDCVCPLHLDPKSGCTRFLKQRKKYLWPSGQFTLIAARNGCPGGKFDEGSLTHWSDGRNWHKYTWGQHQGKRLHLKGVHTFKRHSYHFCTSKNYSPIGGQWPRGSYCILREGGMCPDGFESGFVQFDNEIRSRRQNNTFHGELPDGKYGEDILLYFCCRDDGLRTEGMELPNDHPLILFQAKFLGSDYCQVVSGMSSVLEFFVFDNIDDGIAQFNGTTPRHGIYRGNEYLIYYCYYEPLNYDCGDVIILDRNNLVTTITSPNYPLKYYRNLECHWLIKAPENTTLMLSFKDFDIEEGQSVLKPCTDKLQLGIGHVGQVGAPICGTWNRRNYATLYNTLNIQFLTSMEEQRKGFKAIISVITPESMCYRLEDHGATYRGKVNVTSNFVPCLPWAEMTFCKHHPFKNGDYEDGLDGNYCRNPGDGIRPWCYTEKDGCERQYCDVCLKGMRYDAVDNCGKLSQEDENFCINDIRAPSNCAKTCQSFLPKLPVPEIVGNIRCTLPIPMADATIVGEVKQFYEVGEKIKYKCKLGEEILTRSCLTDRSWTSGGFVCGACKEGWSIFRNYCYKFFDLNLKWNDADRYCSDLGGALTTAKDPVEARFLGTIRIPLRPIWLGLTDQKNEGVFLWTDGTLAKWTNWKKGSPDNKYSAEHCVLMLGEEYHNRWDDAYCKHYYEYNFVCKVKPKGRFVCADKLSNCAGLLQESPTLCTLHRDFAWSQCPNTCGMCNKRSTRRCTFAKATMNAFVISRRRSLFRGRVTRYSCKGGFKLVSGNLDRVCKADGTLSGKPPICIAMEETTSFSNNVVIKDRKGYGSINHVLTGKTPELLISRDGVILEWHFYVGNPGDIALQVYRPYNKSISDRYILVHSKYVRTEKHRYQIVKLSKAEQVEVEEGDLLGIWYGSKEAGVSFETCNGNFYKPSNGIVKTISKNSTEFKTGLEIAFTGPVSCGIFSLKVLLGPVKLDLE